MRKIIESLFATTLLTTLASAQSYGCPFGGYGMMNYGYGIFGLIFWILVLVALVLLIVWLIRQLQAPKIVRKRR